MDGMVKEAEHAAQTLGIQLEFVPANSPEQITGTFSTITRDRADALSPSQVTMSLGDGTALGPYRS